MRLHWDYIAVLVFLGVIAPTLGYFRVRRFLQIPSTTSMERLTLYTSTIAFQWLIVAFIIWRAAVHGVRPDQFGLVIRNGALTASVAICLALVILANQVFSIRKLASNPHEIKGMIVEMALKIFPQGVIERLAFVALVITVAICEEFIYRGFIQGLFQSVGGSVVAGIVGSALLFAAAHVYQGRRGLVSTFVVGALFATVRWWSGNLLPSICAHFVADLAAGFYAPGKLRAALATRSRDTGAGA
ncbi:MAG: CPBP family intramembrane glutamic endopeptidase [Candidatus Acidiferrales bacterium]